MLFSPEEILKTPAKLILDYLQCTEKSELEKKVVQEQEFYNGLGGRQHH